MNMKLISCKCFDLTEGQNLIYQTKQHNFKFNWLLNTKNDSSPIPAVNSHKRESDFDTLNNNIANCFNHYSMAII